MVTLQEIETAIQQLPASEIRELSERLQAYVDQMWDQQLETDLESGKLDSFIAKAKKDIAAKRVRDLDEVLHDT